MEVGIRHGNVDFAMKKNRAHTQDVFEMDSKPTKNAPKKMKFVPKASGRRPPKPIVPKSEVVDDAESCGKEELMRILNEGFAGKPKNEKKSASVRVAFGGDAAKANSNFNPTKPSSSRNQDGEYPFGKPKKEYKEPWNYESYYPVTLPLRRPYSGNPDVLDEEEFETPFESQTNTGIELGLMDETCDPRLMLIQLPRTVPILKQEGAGGSKPPSNLGHSEKICVSTKESPAGLMGKLLVYKSGKVKLKLGEMLYDVNPGSDCKFAEDCVAINTNEKHCSNLGQIHKHVVVTPDVNSILDSIENEDVDLISGRLEYADLG